MHVQLQLLGRPRTRLITPQRVRQHVDRHRLVRPRQQHSEQCPLQPAGQHLRPVVAAHFHRPHHAKLHAPPSGRHLRV